MPELLSPHFIWWSSASSPPLFLIRHGSPLSHSPSLPLRSPCLPGTLCTNFLLPVLLLYPTHHIWLSFSFSFFYRILRSQHFVSALFSSTPRKRHWSHLRSFSSFPLNLQWIACCHFGTLAEYRAGELVGVGKGARGVLNFLAGQSRAGGSHWL